MTSFPASVKSFTRQIDGVSSIDAADVNEAYDEIEAVETRLINVQAVVYQLPIFIENLEEFAGNFIDLRGRAPLNGEMAFCYLDGGFILNLFVEGGGWQTVVSRV